MATFQLTAAEISDSLASEITRLLSLAFTDQRHRDLYNEWERANWLPVAEALHAGGADTMPAHFLAHFPTLQNLKQPPAERVASFHMLERRGMVLAGHVALFDEQMRIGEAAVAGVFIEDVATHPLALGRGVASGLLRAGVEHARERGCEVAGLGTGIPRFYERLGWRKWAGRSTYTSPAGVLTKDSGTMVLSLTKRGEELLEAAGEGELYTGQRLA